MRSIRCVLISLTLLISNSIFADVTQIDNDKLEQLRADGVAIVDVRRLDEWQATGLVDGSSPLTFFDARGRFDIEAWLSELESVAKPEEPLVLICASGVRSAEIATFLDKKMGFANVYNVTRGINAWLGEKRPVVQYQP